LVTEQVEEDQKEGQRPDSVSCRRTVVS
jgi:hypothetical protein